MNEAGRIAVVTIAARNYLALASSMLASIAEFEPDADRFVFITDDVDECEAFVEGRIVTPADVFSRDAYARLARDYDLTELATAVKPSVLRYLLVPALFPRTAIVQYRGCNVAYWNLHSRPLVESDPPRLASGEPIIFFHFSSFDARKPERLSRFQTRVDVADEPALERLLASYARRVIERGHLQRRKLPYGLARFSPRAGLRLLARKVCWQARRLLYWSSEGSRA
jgi:hypothetical protein